MQRITLRKEPRLEARHEAFAYQTEAVKAIRDREYAAVFHEQGLGKTKIAIDLMLYWLEKKLVDTVLFVVKKNLLQNWQNELAMHTFIRPKVLSQNRRANFYAFNSPARVMLTHFEVLKSERERMKLFLKTRTVAVILDESARIKNPEAALTRALFELGPGFARRVIMTGTPIANRPQDIWSQICFLDQGASLGTDFSAFKRKVALSNDLRGDREGQQIFEEHLEHTYAMISAFSVRENKRSGVINLPQKVFQSIAANWEPHQFDLYCQIRDDLRAIVIREGLPTEDRAENILKRLLRLVQIASNPRLIDANYAAEPGKLAPLLDLVGSVHDKNQKCIVWTSFTDNVDWLARELRPYGARRVHGKLPIDARNRAIEAFLADPDTEVLIATPGAAKEGLTLTVANHVIFYDRSFSLDDYVQAQDRIHRISQEKTCYVHNLIMEESVDEWVDVLLHSKEIAAQLGQGDISLEYYKSQMSYDFGDILRHVLNLEDA